MWLCRMFFIAWELRKREDRKSRGRKSVHVFVRTWAVTGEGIRCLLEGHVAFPVSPSPPFVNL